MNISKIMESERKKKKISQMALAKMTGLNRRTIAAWERGEHGMTIENADKVFKALGISVTIGKERSGMKEVTLELLIESLINDFRDYQKEWLTSHNDIEFDRPEEDLILAFLDDTADCYISEHIE